MTLGEQILHGLHEVVVSLLAIQLGPLLQQTNTGVLRGAADGNLVGLGVSEAVVA